MKETPNDQDVPPFVFYSDDAFTLHVGNHYEGLILEAKDNMKAVITFKNINGCYSSIPTERMSNLLEKYYKLIQQSMKQEEMKSGGTEGMLVAQAELKERVKAQKVSEKKKSAALTKEALAGSF